MVLKRVLCSLLVLLLITGAVPVQAAEGPRQVPLFFQTDYPNDRYGSGTVASGGCGITALAMVASYMTGHTYFPDELADYFGDYGRNNMERLEYASDALQLPWRKAENIHEVLNALEEGELAILLMNSSSVFTDSQHFILLTGMSEDGKIFVNDPYGPNYDNWLLQNGFANGFEEADILCGYSGGWIYEVSAMEEEHFIYREEKPDVEPRYPDIQLTWEEQQLLAKIIWVEARGEPAQGQQAVAEVVFNRLLSGEYGDTLADVIFAEGEFRSVAYLEDAECWQAQFEAIENALEGPYVLPAEVIHFANWPVNDSVWGQIGGHIFCYG